MRDMFGPLWNRASANKIFGVGLTLAAATGVFFVLSGGSRRHCGVCLKPVPATQSSSSIHSVETTPPTGMVHLIDLPKMFDEERPAPTGPLISFDEPPLSKELAEVPVTLAAGVKPMMAIAPNTNPSSNSEIVQAAFSEPAEKLFHDPVVRVGQVRNESQLGKVLVEAAPMPGSGPDREKIADTIHREIAPMPRPVQ